MNIHKEFSAFHILRIPTLQIVTLHQQYLNKLQSNHGQPNDITGTNMSMLALRNWSPQYTYISQTQNTTNNALFAVGWPQQIPCEAHKFIRHQSPYMYTACLSRQARHARILLALYLRATIFGIILLIFVFFFCLAFQFRWPLVF